MILYIAGAYRGKTENDIFENIMRARQVARRLWMEGYVVITPHLNTMFMDGGCPEIFLAGSLLILRRCDGIYMLRNWPTSEGARKELELAKQLGLEIFFEE
jgi:dienelactone hydrolase